LYNRRWLESIDSKLTGFYNCIMIQVTLLDMIEKKREMKGKETWSKVACGAHHRAGQLGETGPPRPFLHHGEGDPKGRSTVLINALGSWEKPVPRGHDSNTNMILILM
jgi:hypothetical protein